MTAGTILCFTGHPGGRRVAADNRFESEARS